LSNPKLRNFAFTAQLPKGYQLFQLLIWLSMAFGPQRCLIDTWAAFAMAESEPLFCHGLEENVRASSHFQRLLFDDGAFFLAHGVFMQLCALDS